jgi:2-dehydropantoate 2-reductase
MVKSSLIGTLYPISTLMAVMPQGQNMLVFGGGAVGAVFSSLIAQHPQAQLTVLCRSNFDTVQRNGYIVTTRSAGKQRFRPGKVIQSLDDVAPTQYDYIICTNKDYTTDGGGWLRELNKVVNSRTVLVATQNGVQTGRLLHHCYPVNTVLGAVTYIGCRQTEPGVIQEHSRMRPYSFRIGTFERTPAALAAQSFLTSLNPSEIEPTNDIRSDIWNKAIYNAAVNPVSALLMRTTHEMLLHSPSRKLVEQVAQETASVAIASGAKVDPRSVTTVIDELKSMPNYYPSMLQDRLKKRTMEVELSCGNIVRIALGLGIDVPALKAVYTDLMALDG